MVSLQGFRLGLDWGVLDLNRSLLGEVGQYTAFYFHLRRAFVCFKEGCRKSCHSLSTTHFTMYLHQ